MCVVPSIIVLMITALIVFHRELTTSWAGSNWKTAHGAGRAGRSFKQPPCSPKAPQAVGLVRGDGLIDRDLVTVRRL